VGSCPLWIFSFIIDMMEMHIKPLIDVHFAFTFQVSMESVAVQFSEPSVEDVTPHDVKFIIF
jgi:hypothetical protein